MTDHLGERSVLTNFEPGQLTGSEITETNLKHFGSVGRPSQVENRAHILFPLFPIIQKFTDEAAWNEIFGGKTKNRQVEFVFV